MAQKVISKTNTKTVLGSDGMETVVEDEKIITVHLKDTDRYYMTFIEQVSSFLGLSGGNDIKLLTILCTRAEWNTGVVRLTKIDREEIVNEIGIHPSNLSKSLKRLVELNLLDGSNGLYTINPMVFWKGRLEERNKLLKSDEGVKWTLNFKV